MARLTNNNTNQFGLRDFGHAAKTFTSEPGYTKTPYSGYLFHVNVSFNQVNRASSAINTKNISVLVKSSELPSVKFDTETLNQYNRKRIINKKVEYQPIKLTFHDDVANNVRNMWIAYNQHYNADSSYVDESSWKLDNVYHNEGISRTYGLDNKANTSFISKIEIYSMGNHEYSKMLLVNPVISSADFDEHDYSDGAKVLQVSFGVEYENIIYSTGTTNNIPGFGADNIENYDQSKSSLGGNSIFEIFGLANNAPNRPNSPVTTQQVYTRDQQRAQNIDPIVGNVTKNISNITPNQYQQIKNTVVNSYTNSQQQFTFPDTTAINRTGTVVSTGLSTYDTYVNRSVAIESNGQNISMIGQVDNVSTTPISMTGSIAAEILVKPVVPRGLTSAETVLFQKSFPSLPSTDPRARQAPYV
jgi:hypothetical protein